MKRLSLALALCGGLGGCGVLEQVIFPIVETPELLSPPPAGLGPFAIQQRRVTLNDAGDGQPAGVTIFEPTDAMGPRPLLVWVLGVNNRPWFQQSLHEYLASHGFVAAVPDTRDISFLDAQYHARNVALARRALDAALAGELGAAVDVARVAIGGYSVGATMAAFEAAEDNRPKALVMWAPSPAFIWQGVNPGALLPLVAQPSLFLLAELDNVTPADEWPATMMANMNLSAQTSFVIPQGVHLYFQQLSSVDDRNPPTMITRAQQQAVALQQTRSYLEGVLAIPPP